MRASVRAEYGVAEIRTLRVFELAELIEWLPDGCALWRSSGGPRSITNEAHLLRMLDYRLQVLAWQQTEDAKHKRNQPKPPQPIPFAGEKAVEEAHAQRQAAARRRRAT